ncbi:type I restriction-modification system subunit M [Raoultella ornithinolytica]|uniref:type I restriction-modification system subunit M n=1 Tax=Raoultella ornithinolytica TaxID=54291 RepID=UPI000F4B3FE5|nr:class I SAM-dependent DNA methyltransferase [Raoultella ornithinolytica]AYW53138.1 SAM-dependent DNA methyltransferase [Raoultella ornithinolytica]EKT9523920.1 SAM-dependent DNA methyltransferase [Raoultella ornithinolytica]EKW7116934.1 SAM-dependent DNA methyltransferase [Raoultella ornithinolytica]ELK6034737.1 SAM-dependent DNA methyltransferase [Raoultella ornithinolytica]ELM7287122.1 SAM-dependent DNA methyltransferase [Raoultella ornithinolytica]
MDHSVHNKLISFIWNIADDCLRDVYVRGKYRDVILPMVVLRRLDTLLEPTKEAVLAEVKFQKEEMQATELDDEPLKAASGYVFYNTSKWTLKSLFNTATNNQQILLANFEEYLLGFSDNVKEIIECFNLKSQIRHMASKHVLLDVVEKFVSPYINLTPEVVEDPDGNKMPALSNLGMGYVFEELIRKFNEENNEEAGEHFTPREVIELMTHLVFDPVKDQLPLTMTVYDPACGSGGMLTESQNFIEEKYPNDSRDIYLYGKEINDETYAICKSDMMIKGNNPENIKVGSTLSTDEFASSRFDFMLSNPPYGKSWASEQKHIKDGSDVIDPRFKVCLKDYWGNVEVVDATPRSSDGQLLFLMEMVNKMKDPSVSPLGSRIASVHNGSSLFTGDAGGGESNIRRFIIENDMLDTIVQLPNNLFYNTGITTYIWVLNNNKPASRKGKVQLIDASLLYRKLRKNLGNKNCEFAPEHITEITDTYLACVDVERKLDTNNDPVGIASKVFSNDDFGYFKVTIERPDRRKACFTQDAIATLRFDKQFSDVMAHLYAEYGEDVYKTTGFGSDQKKSFLKSIEQEILAWCEENGISLNAKTRAKLLDAKHWLALKGVLETAQQLMSDVGNDEFDDFNQFMNLVDKSLKANSMKLSAPEKNAILNAVSWYDESAKKVVKKVVKLSSDKLDALLARYECEMDDLSDFGYYPSEKKGEYVIYETSTDLRDTESVPLKKSIYQYFLDEVKPHINEAWINMDSVKIGYEISFNKYFYRHKPLRSLEEVATDIINLEQKADGLIAQILGIKVSEFQGKD